MKQIKRETPKTRTVDSDKDGVADSHTGVGCMISGLLHVQRAPGMLKVQAVSDSHDFNWETMDVTGVLMKLVAVSDSHDFNWETMDVTHVINHLSFGPFLSEQNKDQFWNGQEPSQQGFDPTLTAFLSKQV
ncbi:hypothetical protein T484DRAFT_1769701 [Baffinella frigidus]|nr:hypothetical protein T484DRAFT_1769701 [Cryptophyta sp. CCMP2293]